MNNKIMTVVFILLSASLASAIDSAPLTGQSTATAEFTSPNGKVKLQSIDPSLVPQGNARVTITPVLLAAQPSPAWGVGADQLIEDMIQGQLKRVSPNVAFPGQYVVLSGKIGWQNLVYATNRHMWAGNLDPNGTFAQEYGQVAWGMVDMQSLTGTDDVSLDMLIVGFHSNDGPTTDAEGLLDDTQAYLASTYTPRAIVIKADGTVINSGPSSQKGKRVIILVQSKLFNTGDTQSGLDQAKNWINNGIITKGDYSLTYTATVGGKTTSATVYVAHPPVAPTVLINGQGWLQLLNSQSDKTYRIYSTTSLSLKWDLVAVIQGSERFEFPVARTGSRFFTAMVQ